MEKMLHQREQYRAEREAWERQTGETQKAFAAFCFYRDMLPHLRSISNAVDDAYGIEVERKRAKVRQWQKWSAKYNWVRRCEAWDDHKARVGAGEQLAAIRDMNQRHATEAKALQQAALQELARLQARIKRAHEAMQADSTLVTPAILSPRVLLRYFIMAAKLERTAMGEPEEVKEIKVVEEERPFGKDVDRDEIARRAKDILKHMGHLDADG